MWLLLGSHIQSRILMGWIQRLALQWLLSISPEALSWQQSLPGPVVMADVWRSNPWNDSSHRRQNQNQEADFPPDGCGCCFVFDGFCHGGLLVQDTADVHDTISPFSPLDLWWMGQSKVFPPQQQAPLLIYRRAVSCQYKCQQSWSDVGCSLSSLTLFVTRKLCFIACR